MIHKPWRWAQLFSRRQPRCDDGENVVTALQALHAKNIRNGHDAGDGEEKSTVITFMCKRTALVKEGLRDA